MERVNYSKSIFVRYILLYLLIVLLACVLLGSILTLTWVSSTNKVREQTALKQANVAVEDLNDQFEPMKSLAVKLSAMKLTQPSFLFSSKLHETELLDVLRQYSSYVGISSEFALVYPDTEKESALFLSSGYKSDYDVYLKRLGLPTNGSVYRFLTEENKKGRCLSTDTCLLFAYPLSGSYNAVLCFAVTTQDLSNRISLMSGLDYGQFSLSYRGTEYIPRQPSNDFVCSSTNSDFTVSVNVEFANAHDFFGLLLKTPLLFLFFFILLSCVVLLAYRCYKPIRRLIEKFDAYGAGKTNELVMLDQLITKLQKESTTLSNQSAIQTNLLRNYLLLMLINNAGSPELADDLSRCGVQMPFSYYAVFVISSAEDNSVAENLEAIASNIYEFSDDSSRLYCVECDSHKHILAVVSCFRQENYAGILYSRIIAYLDYQPTKYNVGLGQTVQSLRELPASYLTSLSSLQEQTNKNGRVESLTDADSPEKLLDQLSARIMSGNIPASKEALSKYMGHCSNETSILLRRFNLFNLKRSIMDICEKTAFHLSEEQISFLLAANDAQSAEQMLGLLVEMICRSVQFSIPHNTLPVSGMVMEYINAHFNEYDISATTIASKLGIGINRVNSLIRQETGRTCKAYLTQLRMEKAKEQLASTDKSVSAIGSAVGFDNTSYFIKLFRETYGVTPETFRKEL